MTYDSLNLYVVDDDKAVRDSLGMLLISRGYRVQTFESGEQFLTRADFMITGCVILDLRMPGMSGLQVFDEIRKRRSPIEVFFLSGHGDISLAVGAVRKGACTWLEKPCDDARLLAEISVAMERSASRAQKLSGQRAARERLALLTLREDEVARLLVKGYATKEIAKALMLSTRTVETHRANIYDKLGTNNFCEIDQVIRLADDE
jgi:two-component system response regulator TtrR